MYCMNVYVFDLRYIYPKISLSVRARVGSVVDTDTCHSVDGCSSPRIIKAVLLTFDSLFDSTLQGTRSLPGQLFPFYVMGKTEKKYMHIQTDTGIY